NRRYFRFNELLLQETLDPPSWPNPCNPAVSMRPSVPTFMHRRPVIEWLHGDVNLARTGVFTGKNAAVAVLGSPSIPVKGEAFAGNCSTAGVWSRAVTYPAAFQNVYFHADWERHWIKSFAFDSNNRLIEVKNFATNADGVVYMTVDPQGNLC